MIYSPITCNITKWDGSTTGNHEALFIIEKGIPEGITIIVWFQLYLIIWLAISVIHIPICHSLLYFLMYVMVNSRQRREAWSARATVNGLNFSKMSRPRPRVMFQPLSICMERSWLALKS